MRQIVATNFAIVLALAMLSTNPTTIMPTSIFASSEGDDSGSGDESGDESGSSEQPEESELAGFELTNRKMTLATPGNNTYIAWWTNQTGNDEVMFRASTDNGVTFSDKINLSNSTDADSQDAEVAVQDERNVIVTWYERNATSNEPVLRISNDNGQTFGGLLRLEADGTLSSWP
jgi:hypothetical protein